MRQEQRRQLRWGERELGRRWTVGSLRSAKVGRVWAFWRTWPVIGGDGEGSERGHDSGACAAADKACTPETGEYAAKERGEGNWRAQDDDDVFSHATIFHQQAVVCWTCGVQNRDATRPGAAKWSPAFDEARLVLSRCYRGRQARFCPPSAKLCSDPPAVTSPAEQPISPDALSLSSC
jgi:hypothetical protein